MIAKHIPMKTVGKSDFAGLVDYITDSQSKVERLGEVAVTNCEASTLSASVAEVIATQQINTRAVGDKTYHLLVGFPLGERPNDKVLSEIETRICASLGFEDHQRISAVHHDTDHLHIHIAINKIHPLKNTMHEPYLAYRTLGEVCAKLEKEYGLQAVNHDSRRTVSEGRAVDMEQHSGIESLLGWIKRECLTEIKGAESWKDLHQVLSDNGLELRERGNGFVVVSGDGVMVKASTVARELSKPALEARLGVFESAKQKRQKKPKREYQKSPVPMRVNTAELYARYKAEQSALTASRADALAKSKRKRDRAVEDVKRNAILRRAAIRIVDSKGINKRVLYSQANAALRDSLATISREHVKERAEHYEGFGRKTWADWLRGEAEKGSQEALTALRAREAAIGLQGNTIRSVGRVIPGLVPLVDSVTKKGTIVFRVGKAAVRDDGEKVQVSRDVTRESLRSALNLTAQKYGELVTVNGSVEFKAMVVRVAAETNLPIIFADAGLERRRQEILTKEKTNERDHQRNSRGDDGGRAIRRGNGVVVAIGATDNNYYRTAGRGGSIVNGGAIVLNKPNIGRIGRVPPPQSKNRLRELSQLGLVRIASGGEVLLPGNVSRNMEQQRAESDNKLRWGVFGAGIKPEHIDAMDKYIAEREEKRIKGFDIPKHSRYTNGIAPVVFAGLRNVNDQVLALVKRDDDVMVLPIDDGTAKRLTRIKVGDSVSITASGSIRTKGRSR